MQNRLARVAGWFWPALSIMPASRRALGVGEVILFLFIAPIALLGLVWLAVGAKLPSIAVSNPMPW